jgi:hypothetical protein
LLPTELNSAEGRQVLHLVSDGVGRRLHPCVRSGCPLANGPEVVARLVAVARSVEMQRPGKAGSHVRQLRKLILQAWGRFFPVQTFAEMFGGLVRDHQRIVGSESERIGRATELLRHLIGDRAPLSLVLRTQAKDWVGVTRLDGKGGTGDVL